MRRLLITAAIAALPTMSMAQDAATCAGDGMLANIIMTHRQSGGYDINTMMEKFGDEPGLRAMVLDAYSKPAMQTPSTRKIMIDEFVNTWSLKCYENGPAVPRKQP